MPRLQPVDPQAATGRTRELLDAVQQKFGRVPNITRLLANSPEALDGYLSFSAALAKGRLDPQLRERIAIAVAGANRCDYCLSAHTEAGKMVGLSPEELAAAQRGESSGEREAAALRFAMKVVRERGWVADEDVAALRQAGFDDGAITEIVAAVVLNVFTNYFNHVAETEVDFSPVKVAGR
ncbi:MAG: peroxidase-related enzyme [Acidobacteria bacterium]|nr:peroxidase-related enzyme [Acidobacteriota bacterium]